MANPNPSPATRFKKGRAPTGGRPKGARDKLTTVFVEDLLAVYQDKGKEAIERAVDKEPLAFLKLVASLLPKQLDIGAHGTITIVDAFTEIARRRANGDARNGGDNRVLEHQPETVRH